MNREDREVREDGEDGEDIADGERTDSDSATSIVAGTPPCAVLLSYLEPKPNLRNHNGEKPSII